MPDPVVPFDPRYKARCPFCNSLGTEWHPDTRRGRCHTCGRGWVLDRPRGTPGRRIPEHLELIDDALMAMRAGRSYQDALEGYDAMGVPGVTPERFSRAWAEAKTLRG